MPRQNLLFFRNKDRAHSPDERELVRRCLEKDSQAFEKIVEKYRDHVYWVAYNLVLDYEDARDISQQTFVKVWNALSVYDPEKSFGGWVTRIAANCAMDFLRTRRRTETVPEIAVTPAALDVMLDIRKIFNTVAPQLPERQRIALVLKEIHGLETSEISDVMKCTESTVRNLLSQAKESFRTKVRELFPEYGM